MTKALRMVAWLAWILIVFAPLCLLAQSKPLPDAPQPQKTFPGPQTAPPPSSNPSSSSEPAPPVTEHVEHSGEPAAPPPGSDNSTIPPNIPQQNPTSPDTERLYKISVNTNFVEIPVTVKDHSGRMVEGLLPKDFSVYEDGIKQTLSYFTSDPLPISAAVLIDVSMSDLALRKVQDGLTSLQGAFSAYDEIAVYTYGNSVARESSFGTAGAHLADALNRVIEDKHGEQAGAPMAGGPFGAGPTVNGHPMDPSVPQIPIVPRVRHVLNDAILEAAVDLSKAPPARRRVIMVIGDGKEDGSQASYSDVLKVLLANRVGVYAVAVGSGAIPIYRKLETINIPGTGVGNILPKYASATGGEVFAEFNRQAIEQAYSQVTVVARNQYTLGYYNKATLAENCRDLEVRVDRPELVVRSKARYCPLPPRRQ
ncbi:MAG TPA: VWA domain-containing protein [Terriglobales bacterium]|nr:VWA domain-containing protein [Terriglobales bacterium]